MQHQGTTGRSDSFKVGDTFGKSWQFDDAAVKHFAKLAGDMNPLHHDVELAKKSRFKRLIVSATHYTSMMLGTLATYVGDRELTVGLECGYQFKKAIFVDDRIEIRWQITAIEPSEKMRGDILHLTGEIRNGEGQLCTTAQAKVLHLHH